MNVAKSLLELVYREAYEQGFLPDDVVNGVSDPDEIFGFVRANPLEELLVARLSPENSLRKEWHSHMKRLRNNALYNIVPIMGLVGVQLGLAATIAYFAYTRNPMNGQSAIDLCYDFVKGSVLIAGVGSILYNFLRRPGSNRLDPEAEYLDDF